jgi:hypothetical protein
MIAATANAGANVRATVTIDGSQALRPAYHWIQGRLLDLPLDDRWVGTSDLSIHGCTHDARCDGCRARGYLCAHTRTRGLRIEGQSDCPPLRSKANMRFSLHIPAIWLVLPAYARLGPSYPTHVHTSAHMSTAPSAHHTMTHHIHTESDMMDDACPCQTIIDPGVLNRA